MSPKRTKRARRSSKPLEEALRAVANALRACGRPSMVIGGIAVIARGVPRLTRDIDATVAGPGTDLGALLRILERHGIVPRIDDPLRFAQRSHVLLLRHAPSGIEVDLSIAWLPFELEAIEASELVTIHGAALRLARAEDLAIYKIAAWRPQDRQDVERLLALHAERMDLQRVRAFARELGAALDDLRRVAEVEELLAHARPVAGRAAANVPKRAGRRGTRRTL